MRRGSSLPRRGCHSDDEDEGGGGLLWWLSAGRTTWKDPRLDDGVPVNLAHIADDGDAVLRGSGGRSGTERRRCGGGAV